MEANRCTVVNFQTHVDDDLYWSGQGTVEFNEQTGRFELRKLVIETLPGETITGDLLRAIPVTAILRAVLPHDDSRLPPGAMRAGPYGLLSDDAQRRMREAGPVTETLEMVAMIYRTAYAVGDPPTKQVELAFEVSRPTAERWVRHARQRGFLGDTPGPGRAGV
jgi:hypothetical protein